MTALGGTKCPKCGMFFEDGKSYGFACQYGGGCGLFGLSSSPAPILAAPPAAERGTMLDEKLVGLTHEIDSQDAEIAALQREIADLRLELAERRGGVWALGFSLLLMWLVALSAVLRGWLT